MTLQVGLFGTGELNVEAGGLVTNNYGYLGYNGGSSGTATVTGADSQWQNTSYLYVGNYGTGELNVEAGGLVTNNYGYLGRYTDSSGTATVTGTDSQWQNTGDLRVGFEGTGELNVEAGGLVTNSVGFLGNNAGSSGTATVTGTDSHWQNANGLFVGYFGTGELNVEAGGLVTNSSGVLGYGSGSSGTATVTGANSQWQNSGDLYVGNSGTGELNVEAGGLISNSTGYLGQHTSSSGTATVTGADSKWDNSGSLYIGGSSSAAGGTGELSVTSGGTVEVANTLKLWNAGTLNLQAGGTVKTTDLDLTLGTFNFTGGTLDVSGNITGTTVSVPDGGIVKGTGDFANLAVLSGGTVAPGNSPGTMSSATTSWAAGGNYQWEINTLASDSGIAGSDPGWDLWNTNDLTVGATSGTPFNIEVTSLTSSNVAGSLLNWDEEATNTWLIATADTGTFTGGVLSRLFVDSSQFSGFNSLGGNSFGLLAGNNGSELYLTFNYTAPVTNPAVPEPGTCGLLLFGLLLLKRRKR